MGDPRPGQIPDNIFVSIQQVKIAENVVVPAGTWLERVAVQAWFDVLGSQTDGAPTANIAGFVQTRVDIDTTGLANGEVTVEAFSAPSYVYAIAGAVIYPESIVRFEEASDSGTPGNVFPADAGDLDVHGGIGRYSRVATDSAGNNACAVGDVILIKLGVGA